MTKVGSSSIAAAYSDADAAGAAAAAASAVAAAASTARSRNSIAGGATIASSVMTSNRKPTNSPK